jgi:AcrR family transcriptional regulator
MPKSTFFNLPEEKRRAIFNLAVEEFALHEYSDVSISRIVERAGIAKGSFYQYFTDKKDLFLYLVDYALQLKLAGLQANLSQQPQGDFFIFIREQLEQGLTFNLSQPQLDQLLYRVMSGTAPFQDENLQKMRAVTMGYARELIELGVASGSLSPEIDREAATFVLRAVIDDFPLYFLGEMGDLAAGMAPPDLTDELRAVLRSRFDAVLAILRDGLGKRS